MERWVSDKLYDILGISDKYVAQFLVALAEKSSSPSAFVAKLKETEAVSVNEGVIKFAQELWDKVS